MHRRSFLRSTAMASAASLLAPAIATATRKRDPVILIVSGWQDVNIGDITHTPGLIGLLRQRLPEAKLILWKKAESAKVDALLHKYYPSLQIVHGQFDKDLVPQTDELKQAFEQADFFVHGSGPAVVGHQHIRCFIGQTKKPFGIFGVTIQDIDPALKTLLAQASFIFTRETASIEVLRKSGLQGDHISFAPDATFVLEINDEQSALAFMRANGLQAKKFICAVPRLRYTPYHKWAKDLNWSEEHIRKVESTNEQYKEIDHAKLREAMIAWVRTTKNKILVCPEMLYQVDIMDELLIDPLPQDVKPFVIKRGYWMPDEAASVYANASAVLSFECHSPIIAAANGTPAFYLRQPTDTIKGQMYYDLGFSDWVFEIDQVSGKAIADRMMAVQRDYPAALQRVKEAVQQVNRQYDTAFSIIKKRKELFA